MPQTVEFDPEAHDLDPARDLMLAIRGLRMGDRVVLPNGTMVKSIAVRHGANLQRRFAVVRKDYDPAQRHKATVLGKSAHKTASEAAMTALGKLGERR